MGERGLTKLDSVGSTGRVVPALKGMRSGAVERWPLLLVTKCARRIFEA